MPSNGSIGAFGVAVIAGVVEVFPRQATVIGHTYFEFGVEMLGLFTLGASLGSVLVTPVGVFAAGYLIADSVDVARSYAALAFALFVGAALGSVLAQLALATTLGGEYGSLAQAGLAFLETGVSASLAVTVAGIAGLGTYVIRESATGVDGSRQSSGIGE
ncbi:hypothetical protein [Natrialba swarupiae]|uniref:Uncharacterized protein n=1 Tax=Natrialba swarupiae TaxID=2448032 RepID=A0A5D5ATY7_9EURY|nr:hypothetical protein [Natrialba swarupiae]TYT63030.1 hypothetical protein FYC77_05140 [Natrialba swarupiae]